MKLNVEWSKPIPLHSGAKENLIYTVDLDKVPRYAGIYVFARRWGKSYEALYIGKSKNIRGRIRNHTNNLRLMRHLEKAKTGRRVLIVGRARPKPGQRLDKILRTLEKGTIRHFLSEGHDLVNKQGIRIRRHEITSDGPVPKAFIPSSMFLEKAKGE